MRLLHPHTLNVLGSVVASSLRLWRGTMGRRESDQPAELPILFDRENAEACRLVREALTELNLDVMILPVPEGGRRFCERLRTLSGDTAVPFLLDPNTGEQRGGAASINAYLFERYGHGSAIPSALQPSPWSLRLARLAGQVRGEHGRQSTPSSARQDVQPLTLYSFESSPYSRPVRERLCELELPYRLVNLSKQQRADLGPAVQRLHLGDYRPLPGSKRERFLAVHGRVQVPYLEDPNTGIALFESRAILRYLETTYGGVDKGSVS